ncbi:methyltransferase domain-containing protein [Leptospira sp. 2 VSF19]|uniref:Methyltransferase domain-containing protein n=1 Tax=Leptospira soteropolitanensis TaxID=2950025 RepID=A0AAW5VAF0_9LEPT|nr:methyltransferase domain-containing protein [Leptospira soteropolitanensis]MCW7491223.1 methyltransferase domain-containing protein [Leptospira soteropolitanensis]MCW7498807.1 methyltransferase domain-containing protein [Leptospira soteropolitanensis]MCW7521600.1 methyltransferase domain-containing protein [Leptospira soteropolitanensis]MCW7524911.1 methyltransferase domain-containing protein [Leptospira soteropolitanensis]MCW7528778.1 methyltransferase domain-containing protein [Leptospira
MEPNVFDQLANQYDTTERKELAEDIASAVQAECKESQSKTVFDYGCGTGLVGLTLTSLVERVVFIDSSEPMLDIVREKIKRLNVHNAEVIHSNFLQNSNTKKADLLLVSLVLLHIPDTKKILHFFYEILNPNGKVLIVDFDKNEKVSHPKVHSGFDQKDLMGLFKKTGFQTVSSSIILEKKNVFMNQDASIFLMVAQK